MSMKDRHPLTPCRFTNGELRGAWPAGVTVAPQSTKLEGWPRPAALALAVLGAGLGIAEPRILLPIALILVGIAGLWVAAARPGSYAAGIACLLVLLQPALVFSIFGRLRDTLVAGVVSTFCLGYLVFRHRAAARAWLRWPLLAYLLLSLPGIARVLADGEIPHVWIMWALTPLLVYLLTVEIATSTERVLHLRRVIGLLAIAQSAVAVAMLIATKGVGWLTVVSEGAAFDAEVLRYNVWRFGEESAGTVVDTRLLFINGTFEHSAAFSQFLALALPTVLWLVARDRSPASRRLWLATTFLLLTVIVFYFQRGVWVAAAVGIGVAALDDRSARRWVVALIIILGSLLAAVPVFRTLITERLASEGSIAGRLENYRNAIELWTHYPLLGVGYGHFNERVVEIGATALNPHNDYVLHLAEEGVPGLLVYVGVFVVWGLKLRRLRRRRGPGPGRFAATLGLATLATYMVSATTGPGQTSLAIFLLLLALWEAEARLTANDSNTAQVPARHPV